MCLKITARSAGLLPALDSMVLSAPSWRSFSTASSLPYCTAIDKAWQTISVLLYHMQSQIYRRLSEWNLLIFMPSPSAHFDHGACYDKNVAHRTSIAIHHIDFCAMGDQQIDDFTVTLPGCQHQAGHLRPKRTSEKKAKRWWWYWSKNKNQKRGNYRNGWEVNEQRSDE